MINKKLALLMSILIMLCGILISCKAKDESTDDGTAAERSAATSGEADVSGKGAASGDTKESSADEPKGEYKPGDILPAPEKLITAKELRLSVTDRNGETGEAAIKSTAAGTVIFMTDDDNRIVAEFVEGGINAYRYDEESKGFVNISEYIEPSDVYGTFFSFGLFQEETEEIDEIIFRYIKREDEDTESFGKVYVYTVYTTRDKDSDNYIDMTKHATVWVDKKTGIFVKYFDKYDEQVWSVNSIRTDNVEIPEYK